MAGTMTTPADLVADVDSLATAARKLQQAIEEVSGTAQSMHRSLTHERFGLSIEAAMDLQKRCQGIIDDLDDDNPEAKPAAIFAQIDEFVALIGFYTARSAS